MPSFSYSSSVRVASQDHHLRLNITHTLAHGSPSDVSHNTQRPLKDLDVLWLSDITIALSGSLDGREIRSQDAACSGLAQHLRTQLKANADRLGLNNISRLFVDDADGLAKLTLTPSRPLPRATRPHVNLVSLRLNYIWKAVAGRNDTVDLVEPLDPFSSTLFLPAEVLLNRVTEQFLIHHVVGPYPLIFGPWCKRLDLEMQYLPSISQSIVEIMARSKNKWFLSKCKRLLKESIINPIARRQHKFVIQTSTTALRACIDDDPASDVSEEEIDDLPATPVLTDEQILCQSLEQLFRVGVPKRRFKPTATPLFESLPQEEDDSLLLLIPDQGTDCWVELSEMAMSPCVPLPVAEYYQTLPADMDIFDGDGGPEDEVWRLDEADTGQGEWEIDAQSDESLISASISLASTTTTFALYGVHHHEPDPAANGLRCDVSQLTSLEDAEAPALSATGSHYEQSRGAAAVMDSESFERLDSCSEGGEEEDMKWLLLEH